VAFFLITSAINVAAVIVVGAALTVGVLPGSESLLLSAGPVALAIAAVLVVTLAVPRLSGRLVPAWSAAGRPKLLRRAARVLDATGDGVDEAVCLLRSRDVRLLGGAAATWRLTSWCSGPAFARSAPPRRSPPSSWHTCSASSGR